MIVISHRGNLRGPVKETENSVDQIHFALALGLHCEVDVWCIDNKYFLGHDYPQYEVSDDFLLTPKLWCHAKNLEAFNSMLKDEVECVFWHQADDFTLTSNKFIWTYPGKPVSERSVIVDLSENWRDNKYNCFGVCSDYC